MKSHDSDQVSQTLTSWPLVLSLLLLVVNDWYLKAAWGNWFTGKLSDFAGIFLLALLVFAMLPARKLMVTVGICLAFAWWKSTLSQPLLDAINGFGLPPIGRVIDYTDLVALGVLPLAWYTIVRREQRPRPRNALRHLLAPPMAVASLAAMVATTPFRNVEIFEIREVSRPATFNPVKVSQTLRKALVELEMQCHESPEPQEQGACSGGSTYLDYVVLNDNRIRFRIDYEPEQGRGFAGGSPGTSPRKVRKALETALDKILGEIELRELPDYPKSRIPATDSPQVQYIVPIFDELASKHGFAKRSFGRYENPQWAKSYWSLKFWFRDEVTLEYAVSSFGDGAILGEIHKTLNERFEGLQFYQFDKGVYSVDLETAVLVSPSETDFIKTD